MSRNASWSVLKATMQTRTMSAKDATIRVRGVRVVHPSVTRAWRSQARHSFSKKMAGVMMPVQRAPSSNFQPLLVRHASMTVSPAVLKMSASLARLASTILRDSA
jgi:hypothetical protein